ncbi:MAG TPA: DUF2092 domain-containing protein [Verrucomicrobiae bacterium]|nr:DUF2092 domain-containing protein [Verrucomicrobiae bacterium]
MSTSARYRPITARNSLAFSLVTCLAIGVCSCFTADAGERQSNGATVRTARGSQAANTIRRSLEFYQAVRSFTLDCELELHVVKASFSGDIADTYSVAMQRPNRMALVLKDNTNAVSVVCDGSRVFTCVGAPNPVESEPAPASLADIKGDAIHKHSAHLDPLDYLRPLIDYGRPDILADGAAAAKSAGAESIDGSTCSHICFAGKGCVWQVWVEEGARPVVHKLECDVSASAIKSFTADPQMAGATISMIARYRNWKLNPEFPVDTFKFTPPPGTEIAELLSRTMAKSLTSLEKHKTDSPAN